MKKLLLSLFVIFTFGFYATYQKQSEVTMVADTKKPSSTTTSLSVQTTTTIPEPAKPEPVVVPVVINTPVETKPTPAPTPKPVAKPAPKPTPKPTPVPVVPTPTPAPTPVVIKPKGKYKDGTYTGDTVDAYYGNVQVQAVINDGKLTDVNILDYPQDRNTSRRINSQALPILVEEAVQAQSANIDGVSGASATSPAFIQSLGSALTLAKN